MEACIQYLIFNEIKNIRSFLRKNNLLDNQHSNCIIQTIRKLILNKKIKSDINKLCDHKDEDLIKSRQKFLSNNNVYNVQDLDWLIKCMDCCVIPSLGIHEEIEPCFRGNEELTETIKRIKNAISNKFKKEYAKNESSQNTLMISSISSIPYLDQSKVIDHIHHEILPFLNKNFGKENDTFFSHVFLSSNQDDLYFLFSKTNQDQWVLTYPVESATLSFYR